PLSRKLLIMLCAVVLMATACGGGDDAGDGSGDGGDEGGNGGAATAVTVTAIDFSFDPDSVEVEPGAEAEITLQNDGEAPHSFTVDDGDFEVEAEAGDSASGTFTAPDEDATLGFHCKFHPQMTGEIVVGAGGTGAGAGGGDKSDTGEGSAENDDGIDY
ncbi:MAG: cupredoxin domain-containing protein, partial [Actinomycetota bacterium]